jgi:hypothetical protein
MMRKINLLYLTLNVCVALTRTAGANKFLRSSTNSLRVIYVVAVAFHGLLVQYEKLQDFRESDDAERRPAWRSMIAGWKRVLPGDGRFSAMLKRDEFYYDLLEIQGAEEEDDEFER